MGPQKLLCVLMESTGSLWVLICPYASLCVFMGPYWSLSVNMNPSNLCAFLCFFKDPNGVLLRHYSSLWIP